MYFEDLDDAARRLIVVHNCVYWNYYDGSMLLWEDTPKYSGDDIYGFKEEIAAINFSNLNPFQDMSGDQKDVLGIIPILNVYAAIGNTTHFEEYGGGHTGRSSHFRVGITLGDWTSLLTLLWHQEEVKKEEMEIYKNSLEGKRAEFNKNRKKYHAQMLEQEYPYVCQYSGCDLDENLTIDHIVALKHNGPNELTNFQFMCGPHNSKKGTKCR